MGRPDLQQKETTIRYSDGVIPTTTTRQAASKFPAKRGGTKDVKIVSEPQRSEVFDTK